MSHETDKPPSASHETSTAACVSQDADEPPSVGHETDKPPSWGSAAQWIVSPSGGLEPVTRARGDRGAIGATPRMWWCERAGTPAGAVVAPAGEPGPRRVLITTPARSRAWRGSVKEV